MQKSFSEYLKTHNLRHTAERDAIFSAVSQTTDPFTPEMILQQLEDANFHVSRASVYNTIELLLDAKIVERHQFTSAIVQYELQCISENYSHVICTVCNTISKIGNEKLNSYISNIKIPKFTIDHYSLYFYGICSKCKYRQTREEIKRNNQFKKEKT
jgi:Fur family ferric uptake transcriptional regulator